MKKRHEWEIREAEERLEKCEEALRRTVAELKKLSDFGPQAAERRGELLKRIELLHDELFDQKEQIRVQQREFDTQQKDFNHRRQMNFIDRIILIGAISAATVVGMHFTPHSESAPPSK